LFQISPRESEKVSHENFLQEGLFCSHHKYYTLMPVVQLTLREGRSLEQIQRTIEGISNVICTEIGVKPEDVTVLVTELPATHIGKAGTVLSAKQTPQNHP